MSTSGYDATALETHNLVRATFVLAAITVAAIIVPLLVTFLGARSRRRAIIGELRAFQGVLVRRLKAVGAGARPSQDITLGLDVLLARIYSTEIAQTLSTKPLGALYDAVALASEAISAYAELQRSERDNPLSWGSDDNVGYQFRMQGQQKERDQRKAALKASAEAAINALENAMAVVQ